MPNGVSPTIPGANRVFKTSPTDKIQYHIKPQTIWLPILIVLKDLHTHSFKKKLVQYNHTNTHTLIPVMSVIFF